MSFVAFKNVSCMRALAAAACFGIGTVAEIYTGTKTIKHYGANNVLVKKETEYSTYRATGIGWGSFVAFIILTS